MVLENLKYHYCKTFNKSKIRLLMIQLTERCNSRCGMCFAWKTKNPRELSIGEFNKIFDNSKLGDMVSISLMGGETFLYRDLLKAVERVSLEHPKTRLFTTSNCFSPKIIPEKAKKINSLIPYTFCTSVDGIGQEHDKVRGIKGAYKNVIATLDAVNSENIDSMISFTITPDNYNKIRDVFGVAKEKGIPFSCRVASSGVYFNNEGEEFNFTEEQKAEILSQLEEIGYADHFLLHGVSDFIKGNRPLGCGAGYFSLYINPELDVFPCTHCPGKWKMGNLRDFNYSIEKLLESKKAREIRKGFVYNCTKCINDVEFCATYGMEQFKCGYWLLKRNPGKLIKAILRK